jgi:hypothetical protein
VAAIFREQYSRARGARLDELVRAAVAQTHRIVSPREVVPALLTRSHRNPRRHRNVIPSAANNAPKLARISSVEAIKRNPNSAKKMAMNVRMVIQVGMERHCNTETYMNSRRKHQQPATISYCVERRSVSFAMSFWAAIVRQLMPLLRNRDAWAASTDTTDRPNFTPRLRTAFWPATTRSWMIQRSSSATARKTVNTIFLRYYANRPSYSKHCKEVPQR